MIFTPYMTPGYWQQPELTAQAFGTDTQGRRYYRSGDAGWLDADGCLWILGRKDRR
jgi:long-subunit acyl-CoA synthetase (AMP-forming)